MNFAKSHLIRGNCSTAAVHINVLEKSTEDFPSESKKLRRNAYHPGLILLCGDRAPSDRVYHARSNRTTPQRGSKAPQSNPHRRTTR